MKVKDFAPLVFDTKVAMFKRGKILEDGVVWSGEPRNDSSWKNFKEQTIMQIDAVNEEPDAEIYLVIE